MRPKRVMEKINSLNLLNYAPQQQGSYFGGRTNGCCSMVRSERTTGYVPSYGSFWDTSSPSKSLSQDEAFNKIVKEQLNPQDNTYSLTLDEGKIEGGTIQNNKDRFSVFDFLDMINPLQHIPVVNYAYRHLTGDSIKPISAIIGGAVFAGPIGAATGLVSAVAEHEAGGSLPETIFSMTSGKGAAAYKKFASYINAAPVKNANYDFNT